MIIYDIMKVTDPVECVSLLGVPVNEKDLTFLPSIPSCKTQMEFGMVAGIITRPDSVTDQ